MRKTDKLLLIILIALCLIVRLISWLPPLKSELDADLKQVYTHIVESAFFAHATPPLGDILNSIAYLIGGDLHAYIFIHSMVYILSLASVSFIFLSLRELKVRMSLSFIFSLFYSLIMMRIEPPTWFHHDDPAYAFLPCYIWGLLRYLKGKSGGIFAGISSAMLVLTSAVPGIVSVFLLGLVSTSLRTRRGILAQIKPVLIPVCLIFVLCAKNYCNIGLFSYATKGGANALMFIQGVNSWKDHDNLYKLIEEEKLPQWYKWCYKNSNGPLALYSPLFGTCMGHGENVNYRPLYDKLKSLKEDHLAELVLKDEHDYLYRDWIFFLGGARDNAERFNAQYNKRSQKVWLSFLLKHPLRVLSGICFSTQKYFLHFGLFFPINSHPALGPILGPGVLTEITKFLVFIMSPFFLGGIGIVYLNFISIPFNIIGGLARRENIRCVLKSTLGPVQILSLGFVMTNAMIIIAACCENDRMLWLGIPYVLIVATYTLERILQTNEKE
jgi:hypothetical protein